MRFEKILMKCDTEGSEKEIFEIVALTTEKFVIYDVTTGKVTSSSEAHKGYLIPGLARHHVPNVEI